MLLAIVVASAIRIAGAQPLSPDVDARSDVSERGRSGVLAAARQLAQTDVEWIAAETGWHVVSVPAIETRSDRELATMFFGNEAGDHGVTPLALYGRETHILYLSDRLTFDNLIDPSILLHELVHHMQVVNAVSISCREAAESQAYHLQVRWLVSHGVPDPYSLLGIAQSDIDDLRCP